MKKFLVAALFVCPVLFAQNPVVRTSDVFNQNHIACGGSSGQLVKDCASGGGVASLGTTTVTETFTVGTGGVTANTFVKLDGSNPAKVVAITTSDTTWYGVAMTTVAAAGSVEVARWGQVNVTIDGNVTAGNAAIASTTTAGYAHDSGTTRNSVSTSNSVATFRASCSSSCAGTTVSVEIVATERGAQSAAGGSAILPKWWMPYGNPDTYNGGVAITVAGGTANAGRRMPLFVPSPGVSVGHLFVYESVADSGKYASFAIYNDAMTSKVCETTPFLLTATGAKAAAFSSACSLPAGTYYLVSTSESTTAQLYIAVQNTQMESAATDAQGAIVGSSNTTTVSTGTGTSIAFNSSLSSVSWVYSSSITPWLIAFGQ